ncbi:MAG: hypothetical protein IJX55_03145 [Clostridia bacterium]|nr:hypothetical protein [Clostridia bacterium]
MTLEKLIEHIRQGGEIEFELGEAEYFHSHDGEKYHIYDKNQLVIFEGTLEEELAFEFCENISFEKDINCFCFNYIL